MGESILRDRLVPFGSEEFSDSSAYRKGIGLIFPNRDVDNVWQHKQTQRRLRGPREEFSFLVNSPSTLESDYPAIGFAHWESTLIFEVSDALSTALENPRERLIRTPGRTQRRLLQ